MADRVGECLAEVLAEESAPDDRPVGIGFLQPDLGSAGAFLASPGEQDEAPHVVGQAVSMNEPTTSSAPGMARSGKYVTYAASTSASAGAQEDGSSQSKRTSLDREAALTGMPEARRRSATRRPVLPVAPITRVVGVDGDGVLFCMSSSVRRGCQTLHS